MSINAPEITVRGTVYQLHWNNGVVARVDRFHEDSKHTLSAEVAVRVNPLGHVHLSRLNMMSTRSRSEYARYCEQRVDTIDWHAVVEQICVLITDYYRQGEPPLIMGDVELPAKAQYRLEPLFPEGESHLIYGEGGIGKSYLAIFFAFLIEQGYSVPGIVPEPGPVLYLDYETRAQVAAARFRRLHKGHDLPNPSGVVYRFSFSPLAHDIEQIQRLVIDRGIVALIVDSAGPACGGEPELAAAAIQYFTALRSLKITTLTIAHKAKGVKPGAGPFGSVYWVNYPRTVYEVRKAQEVDENQFDVILSLIKANEGQLIRPIGFHFAFGDDSLEVTRRDAKDIPALSDALPLREVLAETLRQGAMTIEEMVDATGRDAAQIRVALNRGKDTHFVRLSLREHPGTEHRWGLLMQRDS